MCTAVLADRQTGTTSAVAQSAVRGRTERCAHDPGGAAERRRAAGDAAQERGVQG